MRVALVGYMRSGKDSIANCLQTLDPYTVKISFAAALKREVAESLNATRQQSDPVYTQEFFDKDENRPRFRPLLQWWGTEYRRAQNPDHWVNIVAQEIRAYSLSETQRSMVCTDARFINELDMLHRHGFKIVHLDMPIEQLQQHLAGKGLTREQISQQLNHPSELDWQSYPKDISLPSNFGNLPRLTAQVIAYLKGEAPNDVLKRHIERFYENVYPSIYGRKDESSGR